MKQCEGDRLVIGVYVDDLIITSSNSSLIRYFKEEIMKLFKMTDLGLLFSYLGIDVI